MRWVVAATLAAACCGVPCCHSPTGHQTGLFASTYSAACMWESCSPLSAWVALPGPRSPPLQVRLRLEAAGILIMDTPQGTTWKPGQRLNIAEEENAAAVVGAQ